MARGGRKSGNPNYKNGILISIINEIKPNGALLWQSVANIYHTRSGEVLARNPDDIKRHWHLTLCNKMNKPTGQKGGITDRINYCIRLQLAIAKKTDSVMMGITSDDDATYMYNGANGDNGDDDDEDDEDEDEDEDDQKLPATNDTTIANTVGPAGAVEAVTNAVAAVDATTTTTPAATAANAAVATVTTTTTPAAASANATIASVTVTTTPAAASANAAIAAVTATTTPAATSTDAAVAAITVTATKNNNRKKKVNPVNEKTKNSSNVNHERGSIRKTMDRLADALITRPSAPAPVAAVNPILEHNVMTQLIAFEVDRVMSVHRGYLRDLAKRSRKNGRMLKRLMKDKSDAKRKARKKNLVRKDEEEHSNIDSNSDSDSSSSSSSSSSCYDE